MQLRAIIALHYHHHLALFSSTLICCLAKQLYGVQRTTHTRGDNTGGRKSLASALIMSGDKKQHNQVETGNVRANILQRGVESDTRLAAQPGDCLL